LPLSSKITSLVAPEKVILCYWDLKNHQFGTNSGDSAVLAKMKTDLWSSMIGGNPDSFLAIYENHYQSLFSYGFSLTANREMTKDCIQELFTEIWKTRDSLNKKVSNVRSYLFTWLRRKMLHEMSRLSGEKNSYSHFERSLSNVLPYEDLLIAFQQTEEDKYNLKSALKKLSKGQLEVIRLKFFENLSYSEIAVKTSLSVRTIYNLIYEALGHLRESINLMSVQN
jgi:RNA polymerase sigma-70 factor (ECF subfamily)